MYLNKITIIGNLTRDPELKTLPSGSYVSNLSIATNRTWKDKNGDKKEEVEFHNAVAFGKTAEIISEWMHKGDQIYIEGRLKTTNWEKDGIKHYKTEIVVETFQFGNSKGKNTPPKAQNEPTTNEKAKDEQDIEYPTETVTETEISPTDIPF